MARTESIITLLHYVLRLPLLAVIVNLLPGMHQDLSDGMAALSASIGALNANQVKGTETIVLVSFKS